MSAWAVIDDRGRVVSRHRTRQAAERAMHRLEREYVRMARRGMGGGYGRIRYVIMPPPEAAGREGSDDA